MKKFIILLLLMSFRSYAQLEFGCTKKQFEETFKDLPLDREILKDSSIAISLDNEEVSWFIYFDKITQRSYSMDVMAKTEDFYKYFIHKTKKYKRIDTNKWEYKLDGAIVMLTFEEKHEQKWFRWQYQ